MYLFLLGRDPKLSKLEIAIYFYKNNIKYEILEEQDKYLLIKTKINPKKTIEELAGTTKIIEMYQQSKEIDIKFLDKIEYNKHKFNFSFSSINLPKEEVLYIENLLKDYFKKEKTKAVYKKPKKHTKNEKNYIVNPNNYYSWKLYEGFELFILFLNKNYYFGLTKACFNPKENIYKDKHMPKRKNLYSTSLRIADIMINLLGCTNKTTIVDPFCGTGTFLVEALLKGHDVIGIDQEKQMCRYAKENIEWIKENIGKYQIICGDSGKIKFKADCAVFEPYMGPFLKKMPSEKKARKTVKNLEKIYYFVFRNLSKNLKKKAKVVCILPEIPKYEGSIKISTRVFYENGFKLENVQKYSNMKLENPITYDTPDGSRIIRKIYLLEKR